MAKRAAPKDAKERPYHCRLCDQALAEDELGYVCRHVAHGMMITLVPDASSDGQRTPDTACTACVLAMEQKKKDAEQKADVHVVCERCYRELRKRHIDDFTAADREQGYVLAKRSQYDRLSPPLKPLELGKVYEGRTFKLGFSPIPSQDPISLERMWVRVTCVLKGGVIHGALANDPELFKKKTLKSDDTVVFSLKHVLDVIPETKKSAKAAARSADEAKKAAKEKKAALAAKEKKTALAAKEKKTALAAKEKKTAAKKKTARKTTARRSR